ncbi:hypothetical protein L4G92_04580 [Neisseria sp. ZJ106]|uniref:Uncharacterized protein n=1 Tax=Neisseria lisongii TaxID=2912188 RepID=A0AAW5AJR2_9NEIS|nr:NGO_0222 family membrane protein [Neisseria lisongii]MCF7521324.1 hypothetical protein [Neisseria lisongii]MCF7528711.1 hypothetical protein [Neisseria lisongii]MCF7529569.1 hypothetical protein [Neisseria lisongii]WCL72128.1 hypothetical protein PJU73_03200 [Neisseria lisongii]
MNRRRIYLLCIIFFTLLFMALILLGSYLLAHGEKAYAVAAFLFSFAAVFGQIAALALYARRPPQEGNR